MHEAQDSNGSAKLCTPCGSALDDRDVPAERSGGHDGAATARHAAQHMNVAAADAAPGALAPPATASCPSDAPQPRARPGTGRLAAVVHGDRKVRSQRTADRGRFELEIDGA